MPRAVHLTPLTPLAFLGRAADVFADHTAVVHGPRRETYAELAGHVTRLARAFEASGIARGDRVAYLCPNTPELLVAHFAVPLAKAVLVAINTRLAPQEVATILDHSGARMLVVDTELTGTSLRRSRRRADALEEIILIDGAGAASRVPGTTYADLLARGSDEPMPWKVDDEDATISINYTSGTTGAPKGVMYTHRGALPQRARRERHRRARPPNGVPVDPAHVPLQRLVPPVGDHRGRRNAGDAARIPTGRGVADHPLRGRHAPVRRSACAERTASTTRPPGRSSGRSTS